MAWQGIEAAKQTIEFPAAPSFFSLKKWIKLILKTIGNRKKDCAWGCARGINTTGENLQIEKHKSGRRSFAHQTDLCFSICRFSQVVFIPRAQPHAQSLFLFPIVFGINIYKLKKKTWCLGLYYPSHWKGKPKRKDTVQWQIFVPANFSKLRNQCKDGCNLRKLVVPHLKNCDLRTVSRIRKMSYSLLSGSWLKNVLFYSGR